MSIKINTILGLVIQLAFFVGLIVLQVRLSKQSNRISGLILPILFFLLALPAPFLIVDTGNSVYMMAFLTFLLANIPTLIFLAIYFAYQTRQRIRQELEKMNKKDL
jgi:fumarate reductase subunit D